MENLFQELSPDERREMLMANADKVVSGHSYNRQITEAEKRKYQEELSDDSIELARLEDRLREIKQEFKHEMDPLKEANKERIKRLRTGQIEEYGDVFEINDGEGKINQYSEEGIWIGSRRAVGKDRQSTIHAQIRESLK